jgi:hypothetical protein
MVQTPTMAIAKNKSEEIDLEKRKKITEDWVKTLTEFRCPPPGFDPLTASNTDLIKCGYPPRPDKTKNPKLRALWEREVSKPWEFVKPDFSVPLLRAQVPRKKITFPALISGNWSGACLPSPPTGTKFQTVTANWNVPEISPPASAYLGNGQYQDGTYGLAIWCGIDGFNPNNIVLQSGIEVSVTVTGGTPGPITVWPWFEWVPAGPVSLMGPSVPVNVRDSVSVTICGVSGENSALVSFQNLTTGKTTGFQSYTAPAGTTILGDNAEWIVEDFGLPFPNYTVIGFKDVYATSGQGNLLDYETDNLSLSSATYITLKVDGQDLSTPVPEDAEDFLCFYTG